MRRVLLALISYLLLCTLVFAQSQITPWFQPDGNSVAGAVLNCYVSDPTRPRLAVPCGTPSNPLMVAPTPPIVPSQGLSIYRVNNSGSSAMQIKAQPGLLFSFTLCNTSETGQYVRLYDSTTPVVGVTPVAAGAILVSAGSCQVFNTQFGLYFQNGIAFGVTGANGDADTTPSPANSISGFVGYR